MFAREVDPFAWRKRSNLSKSFITRRKQLYGLRVSARNRPYPARSTHLYASSWANFSLFEGTSSILDYPAKSNASRRGRARPDRQVEIRVLLPFLFPPSLSLHWAHAVRPRAFVDTVVADMAFFIICTFQFGDKYYRTRTRIRVFMRPYDYAVTHRYTHTKHNRRMLRAR